mmetsp:Transcript_5232/g.8381  ORF Transcript_5232/g.8381 Transcript_5232/m.8381 type:complete len:97 (-) Transcript_5232:65-355(-)
MRSGLVSQCHSEEALHRAQLARYRHPKSTEQVTHPSIKHGNLLTSLILRDLYLRHSPLPLTPQPLSPSASEAAQRAGLVPIFRKSGFSGLGLVFGV